MLLQPIWDWLERDVFSLQVDSGGTSPLCNPYCGIDPAVDRPQSDLIRRENLRRYLECFNQWPDTLMIGEAPGWRGCRFSGVPFTSEAQLNGGLPFHGRPTSLCDPPHGEATATVFWKVMRAYHPEFLLWNCLPFHPSQPEQPLSNRRPTSREIFLGSEMLSRLVTLLQPRRVIAVGNSARSALQHLGIAAVALRHPGHGGAKTFEAGIHTIFRLQDRPLAPPSGSQFLAGRTIGYNSGTILAPREDQNLLS